MLKKANRLTKSKDFTTIYRRGKKVVGSYLVLYGRTSPVGKNRIGFSVSKKVGNAVQRNLIKRRLREIVRLSPLAQSAGVDLVIVARSKSKKASFRALKEDLEDLIGRLRLFEKDPL